MNGERLASSVASHGLMSLDIAELTRREVIAAGGGDNCGRRIFGPMGPLWPERCAGVGIGGQADVGGGVEETSLEETPYV